MLNMPQQLTTGQVSVTNSATLIKSHTLRKGIQVNNMGSATIFLGGNSAVTTGTGFPLGAGSSITLDGQLGYQGDIYGIVATGSQTAAYAEYL